MTEKISLSRSLILIALQCLLVSILGLGIIAPRVLPDPENPFSPSLQFVLLAVFLGSTGFMGLVYYGSVKQPGRTFRELGWHTDRLGMQVVTGVAGGVVISAVLLILLALWGQPLRETLTHIRGYSLAERGVFLLIGVAAASVEESLFRGNLLPILSRRFGKPLGLLLMGVIFAIYHLNFRPLSLIFKTTAGVLYGSLCVWQRSLVAPAIAHIVSWIIVGSL